MQAYVECFLKHNLGDDLFLVSLAKRYPHVEMVVLADANYETLASNLPNVKRLDPIAPNSTSRLGRAASRVAAKYEMLRVKSRLAAESDCVISIGGSIFIEPEMSTAVATSIFKRIKTLEDEAVLSSNNRTFVLGANFGPYRSPSFLSFYRKLLGGCADVCFRDRASAALFSNLGNVRVAPDILFSVRFPPTEKNDTALLSLVNLTNRNKFGALSSNEPAYLTTMESLARSCYAHGLTPVLTSFSGPQEDAVACDLLQRRLTEAGIPSKRLDYQTNPDELLAAISSSSLVIGTRFHATVLGMAAGIPTLPIIYSDKTTNMLASAGFNPNEAVDLRSIVSLRNAAANSGSQIEVALRRKMSPIAELASGALEHFSALDTFLGSSSDGEIVSAY